jgi:hypothetical protein
MDEQRIKEMQDRMKRNKRGMGIALIVGGVGGMFLPIPFSMFIGGGVAALGLMTLLSM